eukprot:TRINITY_DN9279_c0_g1_i1.p2 TRINITY_DN9279_c0_g1~~TRINITY_DN9279_c0_g1_i1.p2  ORF type:complete len:120 (-),score=7.83 TRINITY_DN9279_c0_g1_i1:578-937(-)
MSTSNLDSLSSLKRARRGNVESSIGMHNSASAAFSLNCARKAQFSYPTFIIFLLCFSNTIPSYTVGVAVTFFFIVYLLLCSIFESIISSLFTSIATFSPLFTILVKRWMMGVVKGVILT